MSHPSVSSSLETHEGTVKRSCLLCTCLHCSLCSRLCAIATGLFACSYHGVHRPADAADPASWPADFFAVLRRRPHRSTVRLCNVLTLRRARSTKAILVGLGVLTIILRLRQSAHS